MEDLIAKTRTLIEALPYIQQFRGSSVVIKFGGSAMEDKAHHDSILRDVTFMECVGMLPIVVHGGGKAISREMTKRGVEAKFLNGLRVTDEATAKIVREVLTDTISPEIVATIERMGGKAKAICGEDVFRVSKLTATDDKTGKTIDWGFVGKPTEVDASRIQQCLDDNTIPVVTPLGVGPAGKLHNVNADDAAAALAKTIKARKLVFLSDVPGLLADPEDPASLISTLTEKRVEELIANGMVAGGMQPKTRCALDAMKAGVKKVHIVDGRLSHSLLLEIFTEAGVGTEIVA